MTNKPERPVHTPWHFWVIVAVWVAWNILAATDYMMSLTQGAHYYDGLSPAQVAYYQSVPLWAEAMHTLSVWAGVLSAVLLTIRRSEAVWAVMASAAGTAGYCVYVYLLSDGIPAMGALWFMPALVCGLMVALGLYGRSLRRAGMLR